MKPLFFKSTTQISEMMRKTRLEADARLCGVVLLQGFATRSSHTRDISDCHYTVVCFIHKHIIFLLQKKCYRNISQVRLSGRLADRGRHSNRNGCVFGNRPCGIRSFVAMTYEAIPRQIPHLPIRRGEPTSGHEWSAAPPNCLDLLEYFHPITLSRLKRWMSLRGVKRRSNLRASDGLRLPRRPSASSQ